jgi:hypothetical protein
MKKILSLMLVMMIIPSIAYGQEIKYSDMTIEELIFLRNEIDNKIIARLSQGVSFAIGVYEVGIDIESGEYIFTLIEPDLDHRYTSYIAIYPSYDYFIEGTNAVIEYYNLTEKQPIHFRLKEGQVLHIGYGTYAITLLNR